MTDIDEAIRDLGGDSTEVAKTLAAAGARGKRRSRGHCPVANYLAAKFPGHRFEVTWTRVQIDGEGRAVTPPPVGAFVTRFDLGEFPELEEAE